MSKATCWICKATSAPLLSILMTTILYAEAIARGNIILLKYKLINMSEKVNYNLARRQ